MECDICLELYDLDRKRPKVLPCGHSACLACLQRFPDRRCPVCRKTFPSSTNLPDNYTVLRFIDEVTNARSPRRWCKQCKAVANSTCEANHHLQSLNTALQEQVGQLQGQLQQLSQHLKDLTTGCSEEQILDALRFLCGAGTSYDVTVRGGGGGILKGSLLAAGQQGAFNDKIVKMLALSLIKNGAVPQQVARGDANHRADPEVVSPPRPRGRSPPPQTSHALPHSQRVQGRAPIRGQAAPPAPPAPPTPPARAPAASNGAVIEILDAGRLCNMPGHQGSRQKAEFLDRVVESGVRRLTNVNCENDSNWTLTLLQTAAADLEELQLWNAGNDHVAVLQHMPQLRRLAIERVSEDDTNPLSHIFNLFSAMLVPNWRMRLQKLQVWNLPREMTFHLLKLNAETLEELHLLVGTRGNKDWPDSCRDLPEALRDCGLQRLRHLVLWRDTECSHSNDVCNDQLSDVEDDLPGTTVECSWCDNVIPWKDQVGQK